MPELRRSARVASRPAPEPASEELPAPKRAKKATSTKAATTQPAASSKEIQIGDKIPDIKLLNQDEEEIDLAEVAKTSKYVVIFAYPRASTPGCTRQACGFQRNYQFLKSNNVTVFGLSADSTKAQKNFQTKQKLEYSLLSDPGKQLIGILGAKKAPSGIKRSHWIFVDGVLKIKRIQISPEASIDGAKTEVEDFIKGQEDDKEEVKKDEVKDEVKEANAESEEDKTNGTQDTATAEDSKPEKAVVVEASEDGVKIEKSNEEPKAETTIDAVKEEIQKDETKENAEEESTEGSGAGVEAETKAEEPNALQPEPETKEAVAATEAAT